MLSFSLIITPTTYTYITIKRENTILNLVKDSSIITLYSLYLLSSIILDLGASTDQAPGLVKPL